LTGQNISVSLIHIITNTSDSMGVLGNIRVILEHKKNEAFIFLFGKDYSLIPLGSLALHKNSI
jgi:hypothetical protein